MAVERAFDYTVPDAYGPDVCVGSIVRVQLHGRRVRGWVVADHVVSEVDQSKLRPISSVSSAGPTQQVLELAELVAHRYCGPLTPLLRAASPANNVAPASIIVGATPNIPDLGAASSDADHVCDELVERVATLGTTVLRWPPRLDRRRLVGRLLATTGSTIVVTADGRRARAFAQWLGAHDVRVALLHSDESRAATTDAWRIAAGGSCVVVGGRMAVFAPVPDLQRALVLDDADEALQEERSPTWHAREVLSERAEAVGAAVIVVSPMPTAVALQSAKTILTPPPMFEHGGWPRTEIVDLRDADPTSGVLSEPLVDAIRACLDREELAVLVMNRRGGVRLLRCATCHSLTRWDAHGRPLWEHDAPPDIAIRPTFCTECGGTKLRVLSGGVSRLSTQLSLRLGGVEVAAVDAAIPVAPDAPVLFGTEAVLHRDEVRRRRPSLVAFVDFDAELFAARYRANEQALWLVVRAAHLMTGRERSASRVVIQTHDPNHVVVRAAADGDPGFLGEDELVRRRIYELPPFAAIAEVRGEPSAINECALQLAAIMVTAPEIRIDRDDQRLLVHAPDSATLAAVLSIAVSAGRHHGRLRVAVDPPRI